jgi:8-oxo-dGTP pyrophosphatase MutT (NUDIX family)
LCDRRYKEESEGLDDWAAFAFLKNEVGDILMLKTVRRPELWQPPGGRKEKADLDPWSTLVREMREEIGSSVETGTVIASTVLPRDVGFGEVFFWLLDASRITVSSKRHSDEVLKMQWVAPGSLGSAQLYPATHYALKELLGKNE